MGGNGLKTAMQMTAASEIAETSSHLLRSSSQIARVLEALAVRRELVTTELPCGLFAGRIIRADPGGQFIIVSTTTDESANVALLGRARVTFVSEPGDWHVEFVAVEPREAMHDGTRAIRLRYPEILSVLQRRRDTRLDVPPSVPLRCVADAGGITPFEAQIKNISLGGISVLVYSSDIMLEPGTVLVGSRIEVPGADFVTIDLEVRYSEGITLPDGRHAHSSGLRFVGARDDVTRLVEAVEEH